MTYTLKKQIRADLPSISPGIKKTQIHAHSTGNPNSTAQNEADFMGRKDLNSGFYTHVVGNGVVIQTGNVNRGAWDVGGYWNNLTYGAVELIESHKTKAEFERDYAIYCELLHDLAKEAGVPVEVDVTSNVSGIKTHSFCTKNQPSNKSDHIDPLPYLTKWGVTLEQFRKDVANAKKTNVSTGKKKGKDMFLVRVKENDKCYYVGMKKDKVVVDYISDPKRYNNLKAILEVVEVDKEVYVESLRLATGVK